MKKEDELLSLLRDAQDEYHVAVKKHPAHKLVPFEKKVNDCQKALQDFLTKGAKQCPRCKVPAIGMLKTAEIRSGGLLIRPAVYEVGCPVCELGARGNDPESTIKNWNTIKN